MAYTYLNWWIRAQRDAAESNESGADGRLAAALELQEKLDMILRGDQHYDIYVRWKSKSEQSSGWRPDLNDGVRLNVRPLVEAGILRSKFNVKWGKDRGKNPDGSERINDLHLNLAEKQS